MAAIHQRVLRSESIQLLRRKSRSFSFGKMPFGRPLEEKEQEGIERRDHRDGNIPQHTTDTRCSFATFFPGQRGRAGRRRRPSFARPLLRPPLLSPSSLLRFFAFFVFLCLGFLCLFFFLEFDFHLGLFLMSFRLSTLFPSSVFPFICLFCVYFA